MNIQDLVQRPSGRNHVDDPQPTLSLANLDTLPAIKPDFKLNWLKQAIQDLSGTSRNFVSVNQIVEWIKSNVAEYTDTTKEVVVSLIQDQEQFELSNSGEIYCRLRFSGQKNLKHSDLKVPVSELVTVPDTESYGVSHTDAYRFMVGVEKRHVHFSKFSLCYALRVAIEELATTQTDFVQISQVSNWFKKNILGLSSFFKSHIYVMVRNAELFETTYILGNCSCRLNPTAAEKQFFRGKPSLSFTPKYLARINMTSSQNDNCPDIDIEGFSSPEESEDSVTQKTWGCDNDLSSFKTGIAELHHSVVKFDQETKPNVCITWCYVIREAILDLALDNSFVPVKEIAPWISQNLAGCSLQLCSIYSRVGEALNKSVGLFEITGRKGRDCRLNRSATEQDYLQASCRNIREWSWSPEYLARLSSKEIVVHEPEPDPNTQQGCSCRQPNSNQCPTISHQACIKDQKIANGWYCSTCSRTLITWCSAVREAILDLSPDNSYISIQDVVEWLAAHLVGQNISSLKPRIYKIIDKRTQLFEKLRKHGFLLCRLSDSANAEDYLIDDVVKGLKYSPEYFDRRFVIQKVEAEVTQEEIVKEALVPMFTKAIYEQEYCAPNALCADALLPLTQPDLYHHDVVQDFNQPPQEQLTENSAKEQEYSVLDKWMQRQEEEYSVSYSMQCFMDENSEDCIKDLVLNAGLIIFYAGIHQKFQKFDMELNGFRNYKASEAECLASELFWGIDHLIN